MVELQAKSWGCLPGSECVSGFWVGGIGWCVGIIAGIAHWGRGYVGPLGPSG